MQICTPIWICPGLCTSLINKIYIKHDKIQKCFKHFFQPCSQVSLFLALGAVAGTWETLGTMLHLLMIVIIKSEVLFVFGF